MSERITEHHDGFGLNESLAVEAVGDKGFGGSHHEYRITNTVDHGETGYTKETVHIQFQHGPRNEPGSTPGCTTSSIIAILLHHLRQFQTGDFPSRETAVVITKLEEALMWTEKRAKDRARRGVLGSAQK